MKRVQCNRHAFLGGQGLPRHTAGFVLPTAIFLLVILAALAAFMVSLSRTSHISSALDIQGVRAYQAARAGIEWAAWQAVRNPVPVCAPATTLAPFPAGTLAAFTVVVNCVQFGPLADGADTVTIYQVTSTATAGAVGSVDFVSRQIEASFSR